MICHVLPGDAYVETFRETGLEGEVAVFREALVEGDLTGATLDEFFDARDRHHSEADHETKSPYNSFVTSEIKKMLKPGEGDEVNLWFEYELFCSVNMWFCLSLLEGSGAAIYRVEPVLLSTENCWKGFGSMSSGDLKACFDARKKLGADDIQLGIDLWNAFRRRDYAQLLRLGETESKCFPYLKEVCEAAAKQATEPVEIVREIFASGKKDMAEVFPEFSRRAGVYGFGDTQVERILDQL